MLAREVERIVVTECSECFSGLASPSRTEVRPVFLPSEERERGGGPAGRLLYPYAG